jgi:hypothetical protein
MAHIEAGKVAGDGGHVDDSAILASDHLTGSRLGAKDRAHQIDIPMLVPQGIRHVKEIDGLSEDPGGVKEDVEFAAGAGDVADHGIDPSAIGDV